MRLKPTDASRMSYTQSEMIFDSPDQSVVYNQGREEKVEEQILTKEVL